MPGPGRHLGPRLAEAVGAGAVEEATVDALAGRILSLLERAGRLAFRRTLTRVASLERRFTGAYAYLQDGRYPPDVQLGFLSLEREGAAAEHWGELPERLLPGPPPRPLDHDLRIGVLVKPVPVAGSRPRLGDGAFEEALYAIDAIDRKGLREALELKRRDPARITVTAYALAGRPGLEVLRQALAMGADEARLLEPAADEARQVLQDPASVAEVLSAALRDRPHDLVVCGDLATDTAQGAVAPYLAARLGWDQVRGVERLTWSEGEPTRLLVSGEGWQGAELELELPCLVAVAASKQRVELPFRLRDFLHAQTAPVDRQPQRALVPDLAPLFVSHSPRAVAATSGTVEVARTPEKAAAVLLREAGLGGAAVARPAEPFLGEVLGFGRQPQDDTPACLFVAEPLSAGELPPATQAAVEAAARTARGLDLPLDVVLPVDDETDRAAGAGQVLSAVHPRRLYLIEHPGLSRFGWRGHLEWLQEFWGMYRGHPQWLLGPAWATTAFVRFVGQGPPGVERCWSWFNVESVSNGGEPVRVGSGILDGAARAVASLPRDGGLRVLTFAKSVQVDLPGASSPDGASARDDGANEEAETAVFAYRPRLEYDPSDDPLACLLGRLGGVEPTLRDADYIVDVGYGAGGSEGLEQLAEPLRRLLVEELRLANTMIGGTRKVTQDLEVLPLDRQIGQTGVRVSPKVLMALAISGAPQHVDWIAEGTVILSFNIDPDAPLMRLNEHRSRPLVHPIVGDVWETVPRFIEAIRSAR
ncbi:MAG: FAD-binding protein, partial [Acidobacteriota bacterium]